MMIEQIGEDLALPKNRLESCRNERIQKLWKEQVAVLARCRRTELKALAAIRKHCDLTARLDLIQRVGGSGLPTAVLSWSGCPRSARSRVSKPQPSLGLRLTTMTAATTSASVTSSAGANACAGRSIPPRCAGSPLLELAADSPLQALDRRRQRPQARPHRLRQEAARFINTVAARPGRSSRRKPQVRRRPSRSVIASTRSVSPAGCASMSHFC